MVIDIVFFLKIATQIKKKNFVFYIIDQPQVFLFKKFLMNK
jgi:hypothetical protein